MEGPQRYPLDWPVDVPRITNREPGRFKNPTLAEGIKQVMNELRRAGVREGDVVISSNIRLRLDGLPYSGERPTNGDPGVAVYWRKKGELHVMAIDRYKSAEANLRAIALSIEALRALERYGTRQIRDRAFGGFLALPAQAGRSSWRAALGLTVTTVTADDVEAAYRRAVRTAHPDAGGSTEAMSELTRARQDALREIGLVAR